MSTDDALLLKELRTALFYNKRTGVFTWRVKRSNRSAGTEAGTLHRNGYVEVAFKKKKYRAHRLAWFYVTGAWPVQTVDHKNRVRTDNRWSNLRDVSCAAQQLNAHTPKGKNPYRGVTRSRRPPAWKAQIKVAGKSKHLGYFARAEEARDAYLDAKKQLLRKD